MAELFKAATGNLWKFVYAWVLPTAIASFAFWIVIGPHAQDWPVAKILAQLGEESALAGGLAIAFLVLAIAVLLALNGEALFRILQGFSLPGSLYEGGRATQVQRYERLLLLADRETDRTRRNLARERLKLYPEHRLFIAPTRFGCAVAAVELYSKARFSIDYVTFGQELRSLAPDALKRQLEDAEAVVSFFIAFVYLACGFSFVALLFGVGEQDPGLVVSALVAALVGRFFYLRAVNSTLPWRQAVRAVVHMGRVKLAAAYGLELPPTLAAERRMWQSLTAFVAVGDGQLPDQPYDLERFRPGTLGLALDEYRVPDAARMTGLYGGAPLPDAQPTVPGTDGGG
jgi:hypothetical protein